LEAVNTPLLDVLRAGADNACVLASSDGACSNRFHFGAGLASFPCASKT